MRGRRHPAFQFEDFSAVENGNAVSTHTSNADKAGDSEAPGPSEGWSSIKDALRMESYELLDLSAPRCLVLVKSTGEVHQVQASRLELAARFQIPQRDLRLLDPWVPVPIPVSFLVRKHAILANFGAVRVLISRCECAILSSGRVDNEYVLTEEPDVGDKLADKLQHMSRKASTPDGDEPETALRRGGDHWNLPFELRMLEMALDEACSLLGVEVRGVVASATSRMAVLQASVPTGNRMLEELKEIRSEAVKLSSRVGKFKSELEDVMQDDSDMLDMYLQRRHALSAGPAQLQGMATLSGGGTHASGGIPQPVQGHTATLMPARARTQPLAEQGARMASLDGVRPSKNEGASASVPALNATAEEPVRYSSGVSGEVAPQLPHADTGGGQAPWAGTFVRPDGEGVAVGGLAGFGSTMSAIAGDGSIRAQAAAARVLAGAAEGAGPGSEAVGRTPAIPTGPFAISVGPPDDRTEPLPSPFVKAAAAPDARADSLGGSVGLGRSTGDRQPLARSVEVDMQVAGTGVKGPPTASQSLEPTTSIPDRILIGQRTRRATRVGKHGWEAVQLASAVGARAAAASKPTSGSSTPERAATAAMQPLASPSAAAGRVLRQSQSMLPQWVSGGRMPSSARRGSTHDRAGAADATESRSARSFSTAAEAVQLAAVPKEDPNEEAARAEYLSTPGLQGAALSFPNASAQSMPVGLAGPGHTQAFSSMGLAAQTGGGPPHDSVPVASPGRAAMERSTSTSSSSSRSTEILNHLLELRQQAGQANNAVDPHDVQDVENMLEAYSLQLDYYLAQLGDLSEFIDDFQDDIQVDLDKKRNALFAGQLLITLITAGFSFIAMIAGIFGMNLSSGVETANGWFVGVTLLSTGLAASVTISLVTFLRFHRMLFMGD